MPVYIFSCPVCKKRFQLTSAKPSILVGKTFICSNCRYTAPFTQVIGELRQYAQEPDQSSAQRRRGNITVPDGLMDDGPSPDTGDRTRVDTSRQQPKAFLTVAGTGSRFVVTPGATYVLGRKSSDSKADLQLAPDRSLSREHARLAVQMVGGKLMAQILGIKSNNPVLVNGKALAPGQPCTLRNGDRLQLGLTHVLFNL